MDLIVKKALEDIVNGRAGPITGRSLTPEVEAVKKRAGELLPELRRGTSRPGSKKDAEAVADEYFRAVGRLASSESLSHDLEIKAKASNGSMQSVQLPRTLCVRDLQQRLGASGGLVMSGRPLQESEMLYDLWLRDGLGSRTVANPPWVQEVVRNVGG